MVENNTTKPSNGKSGPSPDGKAEDAHLVASVTLPLDATDAEVAEALRKDRLRRSRS
jgi:hypothetical protein